ncbi:MAG: hypothetical protein ACOX1O_02285 [Eggerthellaceae bacterium]|jgi:hypothetical protein
MDVLWTILTVILIILIVLAVFIVLSCVIASLVGVWGRKMCATPEESNRYYPGDELMDRFDQDLVVTVTHGIDIDAPVDKVWPWMYQWGGMKGGSMSSEVAERLVAHISIYNRYELEDLWQAPDSLMPGDFADWDRSGMGHEIADVVDCKYLLGFSDMLHPPKARGAYALSGKLVDDMNFIWGWYFVPIEGDRTRLLIHFKYYGSKNAIMRFALKMVVYNCGSCMQRWMCEYLKQCAEGTRPVSFRNKFFRKVLGTYYTAPKEVQEKMHCPIERDGRSNPAVEYYRPAKLADPAWPPKDGPWNIDEGYYRRHIPEAIADIERKSAEQQRIAQLKIDALKREFEALEEEVPASE